MGWTTVDHNIREKFDLTMNEYGIADSVYHLSRGGWCTKSREYLGHFIGISKRSVINIINKLVDDIGLLERSEKGYLRTTEKWNSAMLKTKISPQIEGEESSPQGVKKVHPEVKNLHPKGEESSPPINNIYSNNSDKDIIYLTQLFYDLISAHINPPTWIKKPPNLKAWYEDIEKLYRIDGQSIENIKAVIEWVVKDKFWAVNILSGAKLRKQYDRLFIGMRKEGGGAPISLSENQDLVNKIQKRREAVSGGLQ